MKKLILLSAIFLVSCSTTSYVTNPLPLPVQPIYEKVLSDELMCLTDESYERLAKSIKQRNAHIETLEDIIESTH